MPSPFEPTCGALLRKQIALFDRRFPEFRRPDGAHGACCYASALFADRVPGARVLHLLGSRRYYRERADDYPAKDPEFYHAVVVIGTTVVDWTRRALDPRAPHPLVQPIAELRREWIKVARCPEEFGL